MKVQKWGNSLGIRIPVSFTEQLKIKEGSELEMILSNQEIILRPIRKKPDLHDLLSRITPENRHHELDFGNPEGNESW